MESLLVTFLNFEIAAWMVRRLPQLSSTQINWFDLPSRIMWQWFGVSANAALNTRWTQFTNHANYKRIDSNVMDCGNVIKIPTPLSAKSYFPLTSMRRTKTILFPGMASKSIQAIANRASGEIGSSVTVSFSITFRRRLSRNINLFSIVSLESSQQQYLSYHLPFVEPCF